MKYCIPGILVLLLGRPLAAQDKSPKDPRTDGAIEKGVAYLRGAPEVRSVELLILTFLHAGIRDNDPDVQRWIKTLLESKPSTTYVVALQAMVLEDLDRVRYQGRIQQCAQYLIDTQCKNGQWGYGEPLGSWDAPPERTKAKAVASGGAKPKKPKVVTRVAVRKTRDGPETGDCSNSQYAALGLRACFDAGIDFPIEVIDRARKAWVESQHPDEDKKGAAASRGWGYYGITFKGSYGAMTAGGLSSVCIYDHLLGKPWTRDPVVEQARNWLVVNFSATGHPQAARGWDGYEPASFVYYYLYALERAGMIYGTETFGPRAWYPEGAKYILDSQNPDGSWKSRARLDENGPVADTCFAILFLRRATAPLKAVASEDRFVTDPK
jgi:hypothetical protein